MTPDASKHDPRPEYLRALLAEAGVTQHEAARRIGVGHRLLKYYLTTPGEGKQFRVAPYPIQYALEGLARAQAIDSSDGAPHCNILAIPKADIDAQIERAARIAQSAEGIRWPLSTTERLAAALVLNRADALVEIDGQRGWTLVEALERLGPDWLAAIPRVSRALGDRR